MPHFFKTQKKALLITGARQTGKTFIIREFVKKMGFHLVEINFLENEDARQLFSSAAEPTTPLLLSKATNLFKLFLSDTGLLSSMYMNGLQVKILNKEKDINFGSVYENETTLFFS